MAVDVIVRERLPVRVVEGLVHEHTQRVSRTRPLHIRVRGFEANQRPCGAVER